MYVNNTSTYFIYITMIGPSTKETGEDASVTVIEGDLLRCPAKYIVHQCNCLTTGAAGLAADMFRAFPHADVYTDGSNRVPGTVDVRGGKPNGDGAYERGVVNLFGQFRPGKAARAGLTSDTAAIRLRWFQTALVELSERGAELESVAFPHLIGCGLAGGDWAAYSQLIEDFAATVAKHGVSVAVVQRSPGAWRQQHQ